MLLNNTCIREKLSKTIISGCFLKNLKKRPKSKIVLTRSKNFEIFSFSVFELRRGYPTIIQARLKIFKVRQIWSVCAREYPHFSKIVSKTIMNFGRNLRSTPPRTLFSTKSSCSAASHFRQTSTLLFSKFQNPTLPWFAIGVTCRASIECR